jgi:hypothetical protein
MRLRNVAKGAVIASMMLSAPIYSAAAVRPAQSVPSAVVTDARVGADLQGESQLTGGFLIPLLVIIAAGLGIGIAADVIGGDGDTDVSPS